MLDLAIERGDVGIERDAGTSRYEQIALIIQHVLGIETRTQPDWAFQAPTALLQLVLEQPRRSMDINASFCQ